MTKQAASKQSTARKRSTSGAKELAPTATSRAREVAARKPTIRDVSRLARVSRMTVSRFFSSPDMLLPVTRDRVAQAVKTLSYVPDRAAGSLSTRRSGFIALLLPTLTNSNFAAVAQGLTTAIRPFNYQLLIGYTEYDVAEEERQIEQMSARRPEAIVVTGDHHSRTCTALLMNSGVPVVEIAELPRRPIDLAVGFSNREVGRMAASHLLSLGYKTIGAIGPGRVADAIDFRGEERLLGFEDELRSAGRPTDLVLRHGGPPFSYESGASGLGVLLEMAPSLDAVFAISDLAAVGVMMECCRRGIKIPSQLGVMGFGDFDIGAQMVPRLTTISVEFENMGFRTGQMLISLLSGESPPLASRVTNVGIRLEQRESTTLKR